MDKQNLRKRIKEVCVDRGLAGEELSEMCSINATYLRQIKGGVKMPSLPVFVDICKAPFRAIVARGPAAALDALEIYTNGRMTNGEKCAILAP